MSFYSEDCHMNEEIKMSVSTITRTKDSKAVYVLFTDGDKSAEFTLPDLKLISNRGFSNDEISQLTEYLDNETDQIFKVAGSIDPMKNFLGY